MNEKEFIQQVNSNWKEAHDKIINGAYDREIEKQKRLIYIKEMYPDEK